VAEAFNVPEGAAAGEWKRVATIVYEGIKRLQTGLSASGLTLAKGEMANCAGFVKRDLRDAARGAQPLESPTGFGGASANITLTTKGLGSPSYAAATLVHEGTHKFLGTWDFSYFDHQSLESNLEGLKTGGKTEAEARGHMAKQGYVQIVSALMAKRLGSPVPAKYRTIRTKLAGWTQVPPTLDDLKTEIGKWLASTVPAEEKVPEAAATDLKAFVDNPQTFAGQNAMDLGVKTPQMLMVLPTSYLLNNADSYMELVLALGT
jgi:hypothetical protein